MCGLLPLGCHQRLAPQSFGLGADHIVFSESLKFLSVSGIHEFVVFPELSGIFYAHILTRFRKVNPNCAEIQLCPQNTVGIPVMQIYVAKNVSIDYICSHFFNLTKV